MISNHIALNLATKGLLNISNVTKGMITFVTVVTPRKKGGGSGAYKGDYRGEYGASLFKKIEEIEDISVIQVHVDWNKMSKDVNKKVEVKLLKKFIKAEILKETGKNLNVQII